MSDTIKQAKPESRIARATHAVDLINAYRDACWEWGAAGLSSRFGGEEGRALQEKYDTARAALIDYVAPLDEPRTIRPKPTIDELEEILAQEGRNNVEILPSGEIRSRSPTPAGPETVTDGKLLAAAMAVVAELTEYAQRVREDWSDFDGRQNRHIIKGILAPLVAAIDARLTPTGRADGSE